MREKINKNKNKSKYIKRISRETEYTRLKYIVIIKDNKKRKRRKRRRSLRLSECIIERAADMTQKCFV